MSFNPNSEGDFLPISLNEVVGIARIPATPGQSNHSGLRYGLRKGLEEGKGSLSVGRPQVNI